MLLPAVIPSGAFNVNSMRKGVNSLETDRNYRLVPLYSVMRRFKAVEPVVLFPYIA